MNSDNRKLLVLAANAAGLQLDWSVPEGSSPWSITGTGDEQGPGQPWNPLEDDGDAFRLAAKCCMKLTFMKAFSGSAPNFGGHGFDEPVFYADDNEQTERAAAMRKAIVKTAAQIGAINWRDLGQTT